VDVSTTFVIDLEIVVGHDYKLVAWGCRRTKS